MDDSIALKLLSLTRRLVEPVGLDVLLGEIASAAAELLRADRVSVFVHDEAAGELWARVADGMPELRVPADKGLVGEALRTAATVLVPDVSVDPRFNRAVDRATGYHTRTLLTVPMLRGDSDGGGGAPAVVGVMQLLNKEGGPFTEEDAQWAQTLAAQAAVALQRALFEDERAARRELQRELSVARDIQQGTWPEVLPEVPGYRLEAWAEPAADTGGDAYDAGVAPDGSLWLLMADATGHGIGPALAAVQVRAMFRIAMRAGLPLDEAMNAINEQVTADTPLGRFVTCAICRVDPQAHTMSYLSAGHGPGYLATTDAEGVAHLEELETTGLPLGVSADVPHDPVIERSFAPGDCLIQLTDGVFEAMSPAEKTWGQRSMEAVLASPPGPGEEQGRVARTVAALRAHAAGTPFVDDVTLLLLTRLPNPKQPGN